MNDMPNPFAGDIHGRGPMPLGGRPTMPDPTPEEVDELLELEARATPGPWVWGLALPEQEGMAGVLSMPDDTEPEVVNCDINGHVRGAMKARDTMLVMAARNELRPLAESWKRQRAEIEALTALVREAVAEIAIAANWAACSDAYGAVAHEQALLREATRLRARLAATGESDAAE